MPEDPHLNRLVAGAYNEGFQDGNTRRVDRSDLFDGGPAAVAQSYREGLADGRSAQHVRQRS